MGPIYKYVADSNSFVSYWNESREYYRKYPRQGQIDAKFEEFLLGTYANCATINCRNNDAKSRRLYLMNRWVLTMLLPCLLSAVVVGIGQISGLRSEAIVMSESEKGNSPPPPPQPPQERSVKDGANTRPLKTQ